MLSYHSWLEHAARWGTTTTFGGCSETAWQYDGSVKQWWLLRSGSVHCGRRSAGAHDSPWFLLNDSERVGVVKRAGCRDTFPPDQGGGLTIKNARHCIVMTLPANRYPSQWRSPIPILHFQKYELWGEMVRSHKSLCNHRPFPARPSFPRYSPSNSMFPMIRYSFP